MKPEERYRALVQKAKEITDLDITYARSRRLEIVMIKACIVNILSRYYGHTTTLIGSLIGLHHSTVIHHLQKHSDRYRQEDEYAELYDALSKHVGLSEESPIDVEGIIETMKACLCA